jgi:3'(2'), 5'-bisphosphate nucleotidase
MTNVENISGYAVELLPIVKEADKAILEIYNNPEHTTVDYKDDQSPVTNADKSAHEIIINGLKQVFPGMPIISEEADHKDNQASLNSNEFWVVDPLDGTKEFIKHNGQFTVCIALVRLGKPIFGIVSAPVLGDIYYGGPASGSFLLQKDGTETAITVANKATDIVFGSVSHPSTETSEYITKNYPNARIQEYGSQLKIVKIASGEGDAYPRMGTTMRIWDVAAGHAILEGAGGKLTRPDGGLIDYRIADFYIGDFVAKRN